MIPLTIISSLNHINNFINYKLDVDNYIDPSSISNIMNSMIKMQFKNNIPDPKFIGNCNIIYDSVKKIIILKDNINEIL